MAAFAPRLNLAARGIILVGIPILLQIVFGVWLFVLLDQVQRETREQVESRKLLSVGSNAMAKITNFYTLFTGRPENESEVAEKNEVMTSIEAELNQLYNLAASKPSQQAQIAALRKDIGDMVALFQDWSKQQGLGEYNANLKRGYFDRQSFTLLKTFARDLWQIISEEHEHYRSNYAERQLTEMRIRNLFWVAAAASLLSAILLSLVYGWLVNTPIKRLRANSLLLSQGKPLLPPLDSQDDFAVLDETLHKVAEDIARASANERAMIDKAEDLICSLDRDNVFTTINYYAESMLGEKAYALIGRKLTDLVVREDAELVGRELQAARKEGGNVSFEARMIHKDGGIIDTRWACFWSGRDGSMFCVANDNSEQKRIERLKHEFLEVISEDLRRPLSEMKKTMLSVISGGQGPITDNIKTRIGGMVNSMDRLILLADNLLDSQKLGSNEIKLELAPVSVSFAIAHAIEMMRGTAEGKQVTLVGVPGTCVVSADQEKLIEVLANLIGNAIKYSPAGTMVKVGQQDVPDSVELTVEDQGPGVPEAYREKIFNAFEQTPEAQAAGQGVGLGLAICKMIVSAHGGTIGVRVGPGGSTFWLRIPKAPAR